MTKPTLRDRPLTVEEYLRMEEHARVRHEYVAGEVYAISGGTVRHNRIILNIATLLRDAGGGRTMPDLRD